MFRLNKTMLSGWLAVLVIAGLLAPVAEATNPGEVGLLSLRIGVGGREAAMGETGVASSTGAAAIYWNPANNVFADFDTELILQHSRYFGLFNQEAAAVAHRVGKGVLGFIFTGFYSDTIERRGSDNTGLVEGTFKPYDVVFGVSYAHPLGESFAVAVNAKMVYERIDIYSDTSLAFDFFVTHKAVVDGLMFAASITNLGGDMILKEDLLPMPTAMRVGASFNPALGDSRKLTLTADVLFPNDTSEKAHVGAEYRLVPELTLRVGTQINYDNQGLTAGAGFRAGILGVDYAYGATKIDGFDDGHKFSINFIW